SYYELERSRQFTQLARRMASATRIVEASYQPDNPEVESARAKVEADMFQAGLEYRQALAKSKTLMGEHLRHVNLALIFACLTLGCTSPLLAQQTGPWLPAQHGVNADADPTPQSGATYLDSTAAPTLAINSALPATG